METDFNQYFRKSLLKLKPYQSAREEFVNVERKMILLDANENPFTTSVNRYPDPMQMELKTEISRWRKVDLEQIYLSNGSDEFISQIVMGSCEPGMDHIVIVPPTFGMYRVAAATFGAGVKEIPLTSEFQLDVPSILAAVNEGSKLLFIPNPNNPTGNSFNSNDIKTLIENFKGLVVIDEAYVEFAKTPSILPLLNNYPNLIVCQTFSKAQGMAGARLGMAFAHKELISFLNRIKAPYNINSLTLNAVLRKLKEQDQVKEQVANLLKERALLEAVLKKVKWVEKCFPSDANFLLIRVDNSIYRYKQLIFAGIVVRNSSKSLGCENTLRISVGTPKENNILIKVLQSLDN
ncbi:histidinol-phosphate transaminase [Flavobacteriaceae bacterium]|jgi:histidinol-phosphate aminotransferase|nr:histidinol-phosphate transaminase [Flavobacteriaceae bacterium]MDB4062642.1 histidinol-phosphate transaminase [Flavobacteriaceae bacterium]MDC0001434.1 histidinol-phosphate transaminase [Flavobacteriaceae bacterium]